MLNIFGAGTHLKLKEKIDSIRELSCFKEGEFTIDIELKKVRHKLLDFEVTENLSDIYESFDNIDIRDIDRMDKAGLDLIIDIFDFLGDMVVGYLWDEDDDGVLDSSYIDFLISYLYYEDIEYANEKKMIETSLFKIILYLKSLIINNKIESLRNGGKNNVSENESKN